VYLKPSPSTSEHKIIIYFPFYYYVDSYFGQLVFVVSIFNDNIKVFGLGLEIFEWEACHMTKYKPACNLVRIGETKDFCAMINKYWL
jgi:hypothetical protein